MASRIDPRRLLEHPTRRRLWEIVVHEPGIHLREAQRRLGVTWGTLAFHVRLLVAARFLRVERRGPRHRLVVAGARAPDAVEDCATVEAILSSLPEDGAGLRVSAIAARIHRSRQLVDYHLRGLAEGGRVVMTHGPGARLVARAPPPEDLLASKRDLHARWLSKSPHDDEQEAG